MSELFDPNEWGPPLAVMLAALAGGGFLLTRLRRQDGEAKLVEREAHRLDLENRRDEALQQLAALETQRDTMNPEDYAAERKALLQQGSHAMRELDQANPPAAGSTPANDEAIAELTRALKAGQIDHLTYAKAIAALGSASGPAAGAAPASPAPAASAAPSAPAAAPATPQGTAPASMSPAWQGAVYALVGAGLIGGLLYFISDAEQPRRDGASMTGNQDLGAGQTPPAGQPPGRPAWVGQEIARAEAALQLNPEDLSALNTLTQLNLDDPAKAWSYNEKARQVDPKNADARMFEAVITSIMGMKDKSQEKFDLLIEEFPEHGGIWAYKGLVLMEMKRFDDAAIALQKAKDLGIQDHSIDNALAAAKNGGKLPGGGLPPPGPKPAGDSPVLVRGTIDIDPGRSTFKAVQLFVNVSDPAQPMPPMAAVKLPPGPFPMDFVVTQADIIPMAANRPLPDTFIVKARLDDDGNAFTRSDTDPQAQLTGVAKGTSGVTIKLQ